MEANEMEPWARDERGEALHEFKRITTWVVPSR
jgi:hypothetical protein